MRYFRSGLTRLKQKMEEKLPPEGDILEYQGINKALLINAVDLVYSLSSEIESKDDNTRFEIISLKRFGSASFKSLTTFLDELKYSYAKRKFNEFLDTLSELIEKTKIVYFIVTKNAIRDDEEISIIKEKILNYKTELDEYIKLKDKFEDSANTLSESHENIINADKTATEKLAELESWNSQAEEYFKSLSTFHDAVQGWDESIKENDAKIRALTKQCESLFNENKALKSDLSKHVEQAEGAAINLEKYEEQNSNLIKEISETLGDANRVGMAASFKERKDELRLQQKIWAIIFVLAVISILALSVYMVLPDLIKYTQDTSYWRQLLFKIAIISPLVWLGWFSVKQYSYTSRIREDYAFKYASSMAYEGHKKATREVDSELERVLLEFTLFNMSLNPIRLYSKKDKETPVQELCDSVLSKLPNFKKISAEAPGGTRITATGDGKE